MSRRTVIAGGTGFLGQSLAAALAAEGHDIVLLTRQTDRARQAAHGRAVLWSPDGTTGAWAAAIAGAETVANLSGESLAARRWTSAQKQRILASRVAATRSLVAAIAAAVSPPSILISASGIGYYGDRADEVLTEESSAGHDFLAGVCVR